MQGTAIEFCDDTVNGQMGCKGCELWNFKICIHCCKPIQLFDGATDEYIHKETGIIDHEAEPIDTCYAGNLVNRYAGHSVGYPAAFDQPQLFLKRLLPPLNWPDLRGKNREGKKDGIFDRYRELPKPWLNGLPRIIFFNDLGDTFTEGLPDDWLAEPSEELRGFSPLQIIEQWKAIVMMFTKRPTAMRKFFDKHPVPDNVMPVTSITGPETINRVRELLKIEARWHGLSVEPLLHDTAQQLEPYLPQITWATTGAESGKSKRPYDLQHFRNFRDACARADTRLFMKQLDKVAAIPEDLYVRQMPRFTLHKETAQ